MRSDDALLLDMLIAARRVERFVEGMTYPEFQDDDMAQSAVIRELQVLGEAARLVSKETRDVLNGIDWRTMIGMRNRLVHEYFAIRLDVVWQTTQNDIPPVIEELTRVVPADGDGEEANEDHST